MGSELEITIGGARCCVSREQVEGRLAGEQPEPLRKYGVEIGGRRFPVKQAVAVGLNVPRASFQTQEAFRALRRLGFEPTEG